MRAQCSLLQVNRSSLYYKKQEQLEDKKLIKKIETLYTCNPELGYRSIKDALWEKYQIKINHKKVLKLMRLMNIQSTHPSKTSGREGKKIDKTKVVSNLLSKLSDIKTNEVWCTDITYIYTPKGYAYLAALLDRRSRCIMGYAISNTMDTHLVLNALNDALSKHKKPKIIHSDQGSQFTSNDWQNKLKNNDIQVSMSGKGKCYDNAHMERFWRTIKYDYIYLYGLITLPALKMGIPAYIRYYNEKRPHSALNKQKPYEFYTTNKII